MGAGAPPPSILDGVPDSTPALARASELSARAAREGFDWPTGEDVLDKIIEEIGELRAVLDDHEKTTEELGDLLFAVVNLGRKLGVGPEQALQQANLKFTRRFRFIETQLADQGRAPKDATLDQLEGLWKEAKSKGL